MKKYSKSIAFTGGLIAYAACATITASWNDWAAGVVLAIAGSFVAYLLSLAALLRTFNTIPYEKDHHASTDPVTDPPITKD